MNLPEFVINVKLGLVLVAFVTVIEVDAAELPSDNVTPVNTILVLLPPSSIVVISVSVEKCNVVDVEK